ncbi:MAG: hypothetical protein IAE78_32665 [Myxococcus sp.]|nr:hypothetical protein [Myxococcus sp.]
MKIADLNELAADAKRLTDRAKSTGPKSPEGKLRSAMNAVKHGLAAKNLLLPGEDVESYESRLDGVFMALAPADEAQAQLAALIGDDLWKLARLDRIEQGIVLGRIEELLGLTHTSDAAARTTSALVVLGTALRQWEAQPQPTERNADFIRRLTAMSDAVDTVENLVIDLPVELMSRCNELLARLHIPIGGNVVPMDVYTEVFQAAGKVMGVLMNKGDQDEAAQGELRKAIATIALPNEAELKRLARYKKMLEDSLQRRLQTLEQLRKLVVASPATAETTERAREYRVKLRLVG